MFLRLWKRLRAEALIFWVSSRLIKAITLLSAFSFGLAVWRFFNANPTSLALHYTLAGASLTASIALWLIKRRLEGNVLDEFRAFPLPEADRFRIRNEIRDLVRAQYGDDVTLETFVGGDAITSKSLNRFLAQGGRIPLEVLTPPRYAHDIRDGDGGPPDAYRLQILMRFVILRAASAGSYVFNAPKVRLESDFIRDRTAPDRLMAAVRQTDFVSSLVTDAVAFERVQGVAAGNKDLLTDGLWSFIRLNDGKAGLFSLSSSPSSNIIGISTLAFARIGPTTGELVVLSQEKGNVVQQNTRAPSGSGSIEWSDIALSGASDLLKLLRYGAERELREECGLDRHLLSRQLSIRCSATPFAFTRFIKRAAKPEFFCVGWIDADLHELKRRSLSLWERMFSRIENDPFAPKIDFSAPSLRHEIARKVEKYRTSPSPVDFSYQLEHGLKLLEEACLDEETGPTIEAFFRRELQNAHVG